MLEVVRYVPGTLLKQRRESGKPCLLLMEASGDLWHFPSHTVPPEKPAYNVSLF